MINFYNQQNKNSIDSDADKQNKDAKSSFKKASTGKYYDPTGEFGASQFKWAMLFITNKLVLFRVLIGILAIFGFLTMSFSLWKIVNFVIYDIVHKPMVEYQLTYIDNYTDLHNAQAPDQLQILNSYSLQGGVGKIDALSEIINPNNRHKVSFDHYFDFNGVLTDVRHESLLPQENRPLVVFGLDSSLFLGSPSIVIKNIKWSRISAHDVVDTNLWQKERLNFEINDFVFTPPSSVDTASINSIKFSIKNNTSYSYSDPLFYISLYQNGLLVGIMKFDLVDFRSLETRNIDIRNFVENLYITSAELHPIIDIYDEESYIRLRR